jgi:hypothetical protein
MFLTTLVSNFGKVEELYFFV